AAKAAAASETPHYHEHRERLRTRFAESGAGALADYELLELLLVRIIPRRDTKPLAKALIARFGDLAGGLGAEPARLAGGSGGGARRRARTPSRARAAGARDAPGAATPPGDRLLVATHRLLPPRDRPSRARAIPRSLPRHQEPADRRRSARRRHGGSRAG